jgi:hypothetical protein
VDIRKIIASTFVAVGRALEFIMTGQSDFRITTEEFAAQDIVYDLVAGKIILEELRSNLKERFDIKLKRPVVLELVKEGKVQSYNFSWLTGSLGKYKSQMMIDGWYHLVYVKSGMKKERFKAILAHELAHAYQHESGLFTDNKAFREGLARWVEYKILLQEGAKKEAEKLLNLKSWIYGRGIFRVLQLEKETGERNLISRLHALTKPSP